MEESTTGMTFLESWHMAMYIGAVIFTVLAIGLYIYHHIRIAGLKNYKDKYDYIRNSEIKTYQLCFISIAIAVAMLINTYGHGSLTFDPVWFSVRLFISMAGGTLVGYIAALVLKYYYPTQLDKKLRKWRFLPRTNPTNGHTMRLLREDEEDVHLDEGMQAEENIFSVDYDVWKDESTGYTKIEKYRGHLVALQCNNCGFYTMRVIREEIVKAPTENEDGALIKHYECQYCSSVRATQFRIARNEDIDRPESAAIEFNKTYSVGAVNIEIHGPEGQKRNYSFESIERAKKFLDEFEIEKAK